jgi:CheY-like chemotaxis protein
MANVLVIEDNPDLAKVLSQLIGAFGYEVYAVDSCEDGINYLESIGLMPEKILCDMRLPGGMDGLTFLKLLRHQREWSSVQFVLMSGRPDDKSEALASGANDYLAKPFDLQELKRVLKSCSD